jgi:hypothetical protein
MQLLIRSNCNRNSRYVRLVTGNRRNLDRKFSTNFSRNIRDGLRSMIRIELDISSNGLGRIGYFVSNVDDTFYINYSVNLFEIRSVAWFGWCINRKLFIDLVTTDILGRFYLPYWWRSLHPV